MKIRRESINQERNEAGSQPTCSCHAVKDSKAMKDSKANDEDVDEDEDGYSSYN